MWPKWLLASVGLAAALGAAVYGIGLLLPATHVARLEGLVARPPDQVAAAIRDVRAYPQWRSGVAVEGVVEGVDAIAYVEATDDRIAYRLTEPVRGREFQTTITEPSLPFGGHWTIALTPEGPGTRVRIQEDGVVRDPVYRFFARFVFGYTSSMARYLRDLGASDIARSGL